MSQVQVLFHPRTLFIIALAVISLLGIYYIRDVAILLLIAFILQAGVRPVVDYAQQTHKIPRFLTTVLVILIVLIFVSIFTFLTADIFLKQLNNLVQNAPGLIRRALESVNGFVPGEQIIIDQVSIDTIVNNIQDTVKNINIRSILQLVAGSTENLSAIGSAGLKILGSTVNAIFTAIIVIFASSYMIIRPKRIYEGLVPFAPDKHQPRILNIANQVQLTVGNWFIGQIILMIIIGLSALVIVITPSILGVQGYTLHQFALVIALIAAITEAIPNIGPTISLAITLLIAIGSGAAFGIVIYIFLAFVLLQQLEGIIIVPTVMKRVIDVDPVLSIFGIIIGFSTAGVVGAIISLPIIASLQVIIRELRFPHEDPVLESKIKGKKRETVKGKKKSK